MSMDAGNTLSDLDVKQHFFRQFKQEQTALQEQMTRLTASTLQPAERASIIDDCLAGISKLSNEIRDAAAYLPAYDQRTYSTAVKSLNENLQERRNASAPKRKFAFTRKKTVAQDKQADSGNGSEKDASVQNSTAAGDSAETGSSYEPEHRSTDPKGNPDSSDAGPIFAASGAITIASLSSTHHKLSVTSSTPDSPISITKIHHSAIDLSDCLSNPFATLTVNTVTESLLICGRTSGAAHITGVRNSSLIVWSRQVRMHECEDCLVYLRCGSRPIIENCKGIRFTPFPPIYETTESQEPDALSMWDQVDDFSWLRAEHSPNWRALQAGDEGTIESGQWELIKTFGATGRSLSKLDELLRAAKVL